MTHKVLDGIMGLCIADALGVPVEFMDRESLRMDPVINMREYGTYNQPRGTWSDDTSMTLCLLDSLSNGLDYKDIMVKFLAWFKEGDYTPFGEAFDIGNGTRKALMRFENGKPALECGGSTDHDNGNGSLMRILPIVFYLRKNYGQDFIQVKEAFHITHNVSALTHAHKRSLIACGIYISIASEILEDKDLEIAIESGISKSMRYYKEHDEFIKDLAYYNRIKSKDFKNTNIDNIKSSGYVVDTLEAVIWCLLNTSSYKECVLRAVNLGEDTDTVAAIAGGLAGLYYGYDGIPSEWVESIVKKDYVVGLCEVDI